MDAVALPRRIRAVGRRIREARALARAFQTPHAPVVAQIIPTRRCNLACTYCNEFDHASDPVPCGELKRRIDRLAALGTGIITLSGGEPLLHPQLPEIVRHIRACGAIATIITNGYLLTPALIRALNAAGLDSLQISIDNVTPDEVSKSPDQVMASVDALALPRRPAITDGSHVRHAKPEPDLLLAAAEQTGMDPATTWYIGDSRWDMMAATAAGMVPIGVATGATDEPTLRAAGAQLTFPDLDSLRLELAGRI